MRASAKTPRKPKKSLAGIKKDIKALVGSRVKFKTKRKWKKTTEDEGILEKTYPNIFTVKVKNRKVAFSYVDVLTHTVELTVIKNKKKIKLAG